MTLIVTLLVMVSLGLYLLGTVLRSVILPHPHHKAAARVVLAGVAAGSFGLFYRAVRK